MSFENDYEAISVQVASMSRCELKERLLHFQGRLKLDFTESYLEGQTDERLRHILMAVYLTEYGRQTV